MSFCFDQENHVGKAMALTLPNGFVCQPDLEFLQPQDPLATLPKFLFSKLYSPSPHTFMSSTVWMRAWPLLSFTSHGTLSKSLSLV